MAQRLTRRDLNRSLLERQLLLRRTSISVPEALEQLVGMQSQVPLAPYVGLWSRLLDFAPSQVADVMLTRQAVRGTLMRATLHLTSARDFLPLWSVIQPAVARMFASSPFARQLAGLDLDQLVGHGRDLLTEHPRSRAELGALLSPAWPDRDPISLAYAVTYLQPVVQVTPRGVSGKCAQSRWTTAPNWLGSEPVTEPPVAEAFVRYLRAFGPARVADFRAWSCLRLPSAALERLRPGLRTFADERGRELLDVPDGVLPDADWAAPPRFLPEFDNVLIAYDDRSRVIPPEHSRWVMTHLGASMLLVDGVVRGTWKIERHAASATLSVHVFDPLSKADQQFVEEEGLALLRFAAPGHAHDVVFAHSP